jgi:hypothetical protein
MVIHIKETFKKMQIQKRSLFYFSAIIHNYQKASFCIKIIDKIG